MMSSTCLLFVLAMIGSCLSRPQKYTDRYDTVNLDEILQSKRLMLPIADCVLEKTKTCAPMAKELKENLLDALQTGCEKCTEAQEKGTYRVVGHLVQNEPELWKKLVDKYDPDRIYAEKYEERAREHGINIPKE